MEESWHKGGFFAGGKKSLFRQKKGVRVKTYINFRKPAKEEEGSAFGKGKQFSNNPAKHACRKGGEQAKKSPLSFFVEHAQKEKKREKKMTLP